MPPRADKPKPGEQQSIEVLQQRFAELNTQKIKAQTNLEHAKSRLADLQKQARDKYGTDDIHELRQKLETMTAENEAARSQYQQALDQIEADLAAVEDKFAASENTGKPTEADQ